MMQQKTKCARLKLEVLSCSHIYLVTSLNKLQELQDSASCISLIAEFIWQVISPSYISSIKVAGIKLTSPAILKHNNQ